MPVDFFPRIAIAAIGQLSRMIQDRACPQDICTKMGQAQWLAWCIPMVLPDGRKPSWSVAIAGVAHAVAAWDNTAVGNFDRGWRDAAVATLRPCAGLRRCVDIACIGPQTA